MTVQSVTLTVPQTVYEQLQRAAEKEHRSVDEVLLEALTAVAPVLETASPDLQGALAQMAYLNDAALWQAARSSMTAEQRARLAELQDKQQREGLSPEQKDEEQALLKLYRETLLVRAQAAALLKQRNYDVSDPTQYPYIEIVERYGGVQPVIKGTRIAVSDIVGYLRLGETPESLVHNILPRLTLAQVHGALSYYYDHQDEIEKLLQENTEDYSRAYLREKLSEEDYYRLTGQKS